MHLSSLKLTLFGLLFIMTFSTHTITSTPKTPQPLANSAALDSRYKIIFLDVVGVLHDGKNPLPTAVTAVKNLVKNHKLVLLSNNPRPGHKTQTKLAQIGFPKNLDVFTSGDATRYYIEKNFAGKKIFHLGQHKNTDLLSGMELQLTSNLHEADLVILSLFTEQDEDAQNHIELLKEIAKTNLPVICSNPDVTAPYGATTRKTGGYYAKLLEDMGKDVMYMGKPHRFIYDLIWQKNGFTEANKKEAIMIGDTVETDIVGANTFGIDSLLVLSGNTGAKIPSPTAISEFLQNLPQQQKPTFYADYL